jgi:hypothetical protein
VPAAIQCGEPKGTTASTSIQTEAPSNRTTPLADMTGEVDIQKKDGWSFWAAKAILVAFVVIVFVVVLYGMTGAYVYTKAYAAHGQTRELSRACQKYKEKLGEFPDKLEALLERKGGHGPFVENRDWFLDPWQVPYQYDPKGPRNDGNRPDIWTVDPANGTLIGNWPKQR